MENTEIMTNEAVENVVETAMENVTPKGHSTLTVVKYGIGSALTVLVWEFVVKPVGRKIKKAIQDHKAETNVTEINEVYEEVDE